MIEVAIMIEGQNGLNWARWKRIARATEDLGFVGLYRSDHVERDRGPGEVRRSLMTGTIFSVDEADARRKAEARGQTLEQLQRQGMIAGTPSQVLDQLGRFEEAGVQRIMLQWLDLDDLQGLEALARAVLG